MIDKEVDRMKATTFTVQQRGHVCFLLRRLDWVEEEDLRRKKLLLRPRLLNESGRCCDEEESLEVVGSDSLHPK